MTKVCTIDGCGKTADSRGWCLPHYMRWRRHGDPEHGGDLTRQSTTGQPCTIEDCDQPVIARELCNNHYRRWKRYGDPTDIVTGAENKERARRRAS